MSFERKQSKDCIVELVLQLFQVLRPQTHWESPLMELTFPQAKALFLLRAEGPLRMSSIAGHLGVGMPTITSLVTKLEEKDLVTREHDIEDRRVVFCSLTERARAEVDQFWRIRREQIAEFVNLLGDDEAELVSRAMEIILKAAQRRAKDTLDASLTAANSTNR